MDSDAGDDREPVATDRIDAGQINTNRLTVNDPSHLPMLCGDPDDPQTLEMGRLRIDTAEGWVDVSAEGGRVVVERIDPPEGLEE